MRTKNSKAFTADERAHLEAVKNLPCSVCDAPAPSDAHHINQGQHYTTVALCKDCHQGSVNGWHGQKVMWRIHKMDELSALNVTLQRLGQRSAA
ncbi:hypothetical protein [Stenotrophomonas maltophilia]|uniref:hypothetical protein n=1 Tax=Stenotrophomonas maltophilia TaxID=40324 RepID=UPI000C14A802|nr:hypothetical protein [Stenotrophomonas maltophilia]